MGRKTWRWAITQLTFTILNVTEIYRQLCSQSENLLMDPGENPQVSRGTVHLLGGLSLSLPLVPGS